MNRILFACFVLVFVSGCSYVAGSPGEDIYKIAVVAPQFGPYQALGLSIINGAELAVDLRNQKGGIDGKKIKLIKVDDGGLAGEGTWRAKSLVSEMVLGVIGHLNSDISIPASEIYSKAMIAEISPGSTSPFFTERDPVRGYVFRTIGRDDKQGEIAARFVQKMGYKKIAVLYNNRSYGFSLASEFVNKINELSKDANIVFYEMYKVKQTDFNKEARTIHELSLQKKPPDVVFFVGEYGDGAKFLSELRNLGLNTAFLGSEGVFDKEFIHASGSKSEGALVLSLPQTDNKDFIESYKNKFNKELGAYSANSFDATNILISAIEKAKEKNPDAIAKVVSKTKDYNGLTGKISFDEKGDLINPNFAIYRVKNGIFVAIK